MIFITKAEILNSYIGNLITFRTNFRFAMFSKKF